jgi:hypothetical protein
VQLYRQLIEISMNTYNIQCQRNGFPLHRPPCIYTAISYMAESLKSNMHHCRKIGMSDTSTTYYSSWQSRFNGIDEAHASMHSHMFIHDQQQSDTNTTKTCAKYRYGLLPTNKLLHQYEKVQSTACPLCGGDRGRWPSLTWRQCQ